MSEPNSQDRQRAREFLDADYSRVAPGEDTGFTVREMLKRGLAQEVIIATAIAEARTRAMLELHRSRQKNVG